MNKTTALFSVVATLTIGLVCLSHASQSKPKTQKTVRAIDTQVRATDANLPHLKSLIKRLLTGTDNGGELRAYYRPQVPIRLDAKIGLSNREVREHFYFANGVLIYVSIESYSYAWDKTTQTLDPSRLALSWRERYYFSGNKIIAWRRSPAERRHEWKLQKKQAQLLELMRAYKKAFQSKNQEVNLEKFFRK